MGDWNALTDQVVRLTISFRHLRTRHIWQACCMFTWRVARDTQYIGDKFE